MNKRMVVPLLMGLLAIAGCARNAATVDIAKGVSERSKEAMTGVATYFDDIETKRQRTAAAVVASDPSCLPEMPLKVQRPSLPRGKQGPLCRTNGLARGHDPDTLDFSATPDDVLKPRLLLIAAVADYGAALGKSQRIRLRTCRVNLRPSRRKSTALLLSCSCSVMMDLLLAGSSRVTKVKQ